jgi:protein-tyrosine phosphatase
MLLANPVAGAYQVSSAGSSAADGAPASRFSVEVAQAQGLDLSAHRSRRLDRTMVRDADLIVTMGVRHREAVGALDPGALEYTYLLTNFSDRHHGEIPDPIGGPSEVYQRTYEVIRDCVASMVAHLPRFDGWKAAARGRKEKP